MFCILLFFRLKSINTASNSRRIDARIKSRLCSFVKKGVKQLMRANSSGQITGRNFVAIFSAHVRMHLRFFRDRIRSRTSRTASNKMNDMERSYERYLAFSDTRGSIHPPTTLLLLRENARAFVSLLK